MNNDLISRSALKEALKEKFDDFIPEGVYDEINNAPTVEEITNEDIQQAIKEGFANGYEMAKEKYERPQGECEKCDYYTFAQAIINGFVELMSKNGITTVEELLETLKGDAE